jgi:flavin-dependent dehydrogenase
VKCDVAIVGAGPAGLAAAICCASAGLKVCVLERKRFPRPCVGESVHPGVAVLFDRLGVAQAVERSSFLRYSGICVIRNNEKQFHAFGGSPAQPWRGFHLWRPEFDEILLQRARAVGAICVEDCTPRNADMARGIVRIASSHGLLESSIVIDGTGRERWIARQWGLKVETHSPTLIARYGYQQGECRRYSDDPVFVWRRNGWDWIARIRTDLYQWISVRFAGTRRPTHEPLRPLHQLTELISPRGADVTWRLVTQSAARHYFLVGDACAVLDPSSSHGVLRGLSSGIFAATCVCEILGQGFRGYHRIVQGYCQWQREWFLRDVSALRNLKQGATLRPTTP